MLVVSAAVAWAPLARGSVWPAGNERILAGLVSTDALERRGASSKLLQLPTKQAREWTLISLRDGDLEVRLHAARAAIALGVEHAGDEVLGWLQEREPRLRTAACEVIQSAPTRDSVAALGRVLSDGRPEVREAAARAMGESAFVEAVSPLLGRTDDPALTVRVAVVRALGRLGDPRAAVPVVSKLQDAESEVRVEAARALGMLRDRKTVSSLELALTDKDAPVQLAALEALGRIGAASSVASIAALLTHGGAADGKLRNDAVREAAVAAIARIQSPDAVRLLVRELETEGPVPYADDAVAPVRRALVGAGPAVRSALLATVEGSSSVRQASAAALALASWAMSSTVSGPEPGGEVAPPAIAAAAIVKAARRGGVELDATLSALERLSEPSGLPFVLEHVGDADAALRERVVDVATHLLEPSAPDGRVVDIVRARVTDVATPLPERVGLIRLLGRTGTKRAATLLLGLLPVRRAAEPVAPNEPVSLRVAIVEALGALGFRDAAVEAVFLEALGHSSERVRVAAAKALARTGGDEATAALLTRLQASAEQDRAAIGMALSGALSRSTGSNVVERVDAALDSASGPARDSLIEGLGRSSAPGAAALLLRLAKSTDVDDRRKVAEGLARRTDSRAALALLAVDPDASVRANALWSLGFSADESLAERARTAISDSDVAVAGNAMLAVARLALRATGGTEEASKALCRGLSDTRSYVVVEALVGLRMLSSTCADGAVRHLLETASSSRVRAASAALLREFATRPPTSDVPGEEERRLSRLALLRCGQDDRHALVARACREGAAVRKDATGKNDLTIYVVPEGSVEPMAHAPFALVLPDGSLRLGYADRRGVVFEAALPDGQVELAVPAPLVP
jgi:HEAT repeat protein